MLVTMSHASSSPPLLVNPPFLQVVLFFTCLLVMDDAFFCTFECMRERKKIMRGHAFLESMF